MGPVARLTFDEATEIRPHWTPDGEYVSFTSLRGDDVTGSLWKKRADGTGSAEPVFDGFDVNEGVWSPAGDWIVLMSDASGGNPQPIFALRPGIDSVAMPLLTEDGIRYNGPNVSRDGRWLAYSSDETGRSEVFVSPFPDVNAGKWQVSTSGGGQSLWAHNGREIFYLTTSAAGAAIQTGIKMWATEFATEPTFRVGSSSTLFDLPDGYRTTTVGGGDNKDVLPDDQRFLLARLVGLEDSPTKLILVQNFFEELKARVPN